MRGPSSSHTAGPFHISTLARALLGDEPASATFTFDPDGSFGEVYREQGSDLGFAAGTMGWSITDERFPRALDWAARQGLEITFRVERLPSADHPNTVELRMTSERGRTLHAVAQSIGGGAVSFTEADGWPVRLTGDAYEVLARVDQQAEPMVRERLTADGAAIGSPDRLSRDQEVLLRVRRRSPLDAHTLTQLEALKGVSCLRTAPPLGFTPRGEALFASAGDMVAIAEERGCSLGHLARSYESELLGLSEDEVQDEILQRFEVMRASVDQGLHENLSRMQLLHPSAGRIYRAESEGRTAAGGLHTRIAARALAVMHTNVNMGVVCAAPTAGAAGVLPGVLVTLAEENGLSPEQVAMGLLAASSVGLVVATRATFAAEIAGCQMEIGTSKAMAAAAVVELAGAPAREATDAAAIALQNSMGLICDPVRGLVEVPCHTRNAAAASEAVVCADLILGGYTNPIPLDETIDAAYAAGRMLPRELRCTARGGLALAPSASRYAYTR